jgi:DNA-binding GntR family transcriptional regulator
MSDNEYLGKGDVVTELLREMITTGELPPGTELHELTEQDRP